MELMKVECTFCGGRYYIIANDIDLLLAKDIGPGEAFPNECPFCEPVRYAVLVDENSN